MMVQAFYRLRLPMSAVVVAGAFLVVGCSQHPAAKTASSEVGGSPAAKAAAPAPEKPVTTEPQKAAGESTAADGAGEAEHHSGLRAAPEPPDGKWLKDDQGREYFLEKIKKYPGAYRWIDEHRVRMYFGGLFDVAKEDNDYLYVKLYRVEEAPSNTLFKRPEPTKEELDEVEATYKVEMKTSDRLHFSPFDQGLPKAGQWRNGFAIADMNHDGFLDIVHAPPRKGVSRPYIYLGDGHGTWRIWRASYPGEVFDYGDLVVADWNGDGIPDMALGIHLHGILALVSDGNGGFRDWSKGLDYQVPGHGGDASGFTSRALAVADWNGDGRPDLLALGEGPRLDTSSPAGGGARGVAAAAYGVVLYLNDGDGSWKRVDQGTDASKIFGDALTVGDFDGDGRPDFATSSSIMGRSDLVNLHQKDGSWKAVDIPDLRPGSYVRGVLAKDLDGDGRADLVVSYVNFQLGVWRSGVDIFFSMPDGAWRRQTVAAELGKVGFSSTGAGDLDGDGKLDLVAVDGDGGLHVFLGAGGGSFTREDSPELIKPKGSCQGYLVHLADLDGDGRDEIVVDFADEASAMFDPLRCPSGGEIQAWRAALSN